MNWFGTQFRAFFARWFGPTDEETPPVEPPVPAPAPSVSAGPPRPRFDPERLRRLREEDEIVMATIAAFMNLKANS